MPIGREYLVVNTGEYLGDQTAISKWASTPIGPVFAARYGTNPDDTACLKSELATKLINAGATITQDLCPQCKFRNSCDYLKQLAPIRLRTYDTPEDCDDLGFILPLLVGFDLVEVDHAGGCPPWAAWGGW